MIGCRNIFLAPDYQRIIKSFCSQKKMLCMPKFALPVQEKIAGFALFGLSMQSNFNAEKKRYIYFCLTISIQHENSHHYRRQWKFGIGRY